MAHQPAVAVVVLGSGALVQLHDGDADGVDRESWAPMVVQYGQADVPIGADVGVLRRLSDEHHLWVLQRVSWREAAEAEGEALAVVERAGRCAGAT
eukprot:CAMPEP_0203848996 /NCGR_PEP_ID=MMETSP0359-20131031/5929_1 /ASSEMBLY_ACC=CAM_ASM_000338 /TAXON_ID=268821 /ORGANISM="Scrippsiella Hangoei, Strain SHTV-5" /LENGTH=95 /DNA_ID=CAMNT_0050764679 /DNA_START=193 /DNA_END=478 /DNA_ORIENTATION=+